MSGAVYRTFFFIYVFGLFANEMFAQNLLGGKGAATATSTLVYFIWLSCSTLSLNLTLSPDLRMCLRPVLCKCYIKLPES